MNDETKRFHDRFTSLFESGGLENVKFFVRDAEDVKLADFIEDANKISDTISAGHFEVVESVDVDCETKQFDAAF